MTTQKIDVLAFLDTLRDQLLEEEWDNTANGLDQVRVSVAVMIDTLESAAETLSMIDEDHGLVLASEEVRHIREVLARIGGVE